jgi:hypothetical protein
LHVLAGRDFGSFDEIDDEANHGEEEEEGCEHDHHDLSSVATSSSILDESISVKELIRVNGEFFGDVEDGDELLAELIKDREREELCVLQVHENREGFRVPDDVSGGWLDLGLKVVNFTHCIRIGLFVDLNFAKQISRAVNATLLSDDIVDVVSRANVQSVRRREHESVSLTVTHVPLSVDLGLDLAINSCH